MRSSQNEKQERRMSPSRQVVNEYSLATALQETRNS